MGLTDACGEKRQAGMHCNNRIRQTQSAATTSPSIHSGKTARPPSRFHLIFSQTLVIHTDNGCRGQTFSRYDTILGIPGEHVLHILGLTWPTWLVQRMAKKERNEYSHQPMSKDSSFYITAPPTRYTLCLIH